jgi:hypothetical protein
MSRSNQAAIRRRVSEAPSNIQPVPTPPNNTPTNSTQPQSSLQPRMTMQQVVILLDQRVKELENAKTEVNNTVSVNDLNSIISEFNSRFEILAKEIDDIKNMLLKLQSYTMDVNKMLVDERIQILSNIDDLDQSNLNITDEVVNITDDIEINNKPSDIKIVGDTDTSEINISEEQNN